MNHFTAADTLLIVGMVVAYILFTTWLTFRLRSKNNDYKALECVHFFESEIFALKTKLLQYQNAHYFDLVLLESY